MLPLCEITYHIANAKWKGGSCHVALACDGLPVNASGHCCCIPDSPPFLSRCCNVDRFQESARSALLPWPAPVPTCPPIRECNGSLLRITCHGIQRRSTVPACNILNISTLLPDSSDAPGPDQMRQAVSVVGQQSTHSPAHHITSLPTQGSLGSAFALFKYPYPSSLTEIALLALTCRVAPCLAFSWLCSALLCLGLALLCFVYPRDG